MQVTIKSWDKYNPRKDVKKPSWLRLENTVMFSQSLDGLNPAEKWLWICIMSYAGFKQSDTVEVRPTYFSKHSGLKVSEIEKALPKFVELGLIEVLRTDTIVDVRARENTSSTRRNETERTRRTERDETNAPDSQASVRVSTSFQNWEVSESQWKSWMDAYEPGLHDSELSAFVGPELRKAKAWLEANKHKAPKRFDRFFTSWLSRGWEQHRRSLPSNAPQRRGIADILKEKGDR